MDRALLYHGTQVISGFAFVLIAIEQASSGGLDGTAQTALAILLLLSGSAIIVGNALRLTVSEMDRLDPAPVWVWLSVLATVLLLVGAIMSLAV